MIGSADLLVATDLDGTFLDHDTYSYAAALPAIRALQQRNVPVIFVTSKTAAEVQVLQEQIGLRQPFIVENGGVIVIPDGYFSNVGEKHVLGAGIEDIQLFLKNCRAFGDQFTGFSDMSAEDVARVTGLPINDAALAKERISSEPLIWEGDATSKRNFVDATKRAGFQALQGGRFLTIGGKIDKGQALLKLLKLFQKYGKTIKTTIALGDSGNDVALLDSANIPVWVRKRENTPETEFRANARCTVRYGPSGWYDAVCEIFGLDL